MSGFDHEQTFETAGSGPESPRTAIPATLPVTASADLTAAGTLNAIGIEVVFDDLPATILMTITDGSSNSGTASLITTGGIFAPQVLTLVFAGFTGAIDFSDIETISMQLTATMPATDVQIGFIESTFVPEPSTTMLLGFSIVVLGARLRR